MSLSTGLRPRIAVELIDNPGTNQELTFDADSVPFDNQLGVVVLRWSLDVQMDPDRYLLGDVAPAHDVHGEGIDRTRDDAAGRNVELRMLHRALVVIVVDRNRVRKLPRIERERERER